MTKKLAIGAAAALPALFLATGPATAAIDTHVAPGDIVFGDIVLQEYIELVNTTPNSYPLEDHGLVGCVGANDDAPIVFIDNFGVNDEIFGFDNFIIADPSATTVTPDVVVDLSELNSGDLDLRFVDNFGVFGQEEAVAHFTNGNPDPDCVASLPPITP